MNNTINIIDGQQNTNINKKSDLYIKIFGEEPRNEWYQCQDCQSLFSLSEIAKKEIKDCLCGWNLNAFYNPEKVEKDRSDRSKSQWYIERLAENLDNDLVWFALWWESDINQLNQKKFWLAQNQLWELTNNINSLDKLTDLQKLYYFSEVWVEKQYRWKSNIASKLYNDIENQVKSNWYKTMILRTTKKTDVPYKWFQKLWFQEVFSYNDQQDRVIMIKQLF